jgi:hypothetical protein
MRGEIGRLAEANTWRLDPDTMLKRLISSFFTNLIKLLTLILCLSASLSTSVKEANAAPLLFTPFAAMSVEGFFSRMDGRMGFDQNPILALNGTLNDLRTDLGLPANNMTWRINLYVRPLEHHALRMYGSIPERYLGTNTLEREIVAQNTRFPVGTKVRSEMRTGQFGFGYDLDFLIGPRWYAGLNGDLRYINLFSRISSAGTGLGETVSLSELVPCLGAHAANRLPLGLDTIFAPAILGGNARMTYGVTPDFLNYINITLGLTADLRFLTGMIIQTEVGYEYEIMEHNQSATTGRVMEVQRDGIYFRVGGAF